MCRGSRTTATRRASTPRPAPAALRSLQLHPQNRCGTLAELPGLERLRHVVVDFDLAESLVLLLRALVERGHHDDLRCSEIRARLDAAAHLAPVEPRHERVRQNDLRAVLVRELEALFAVCRDHDAVTEALDHRDRGGANIDLVVNNQDERPPDSVRLRVYPGLRDSCERGPAAPQRLGLVDPEVLADGG